MNDADALFEALADKTRRAAIGALTERPYAAGELAKTLLISPQALSRHLKVLRHAGLVTIDSVDDDARQRIYRIRERAFAPLRNWLDDAESLWTEQLAAFKDYAGKQAK